MRKLLLVPAFLTLLLTSALAQGPSGGGIGPGPVPSPWLLNGSTLSYSNGGLNLPRTVPGGDKGIGTINVSVGYYVNGVLSLPISTATAPLAITSGTISLNLDGNFAVSGGNLALSPVAAGHLLANCTSGNAEPGNCSWNSYASQAIGTTANSLPYYSGSWGTVTTGSSVLNPGTGTLETVLQIQTNAIASKAFSTADFFWETRRSNSGSAMTDSFPAAGTTGLVNGTRITVNNVDATASDTITAGSGTTFSAGSTDVIGPGRAIQYAYDLANTTWRKTLNTGVALLGPNNLSDVSSISTARNNLIPSGTITNSQLVNASTTVNGQTCTLGSTCTITASAGNITVGTTGVLSGTSGRVLYDNGSVLGELAVTGSGNAVLATSPSMSGVIVTGSFTATGLVTNADLVNSTMTISGTTCTLGSSCAPASTLVVGSSSVTSGTNGYILYNNAGTLGNLATTGSGIVVLQTSPNLSGVTVTGSFTATGLVTAADLFGTNGTGNVVLTTNASLVTPTLGVAAGTSLALNGCTIGANTLCTTGTSALNTIIATSANATALAVGPNGTTNPAFVVNANTASLASGLKVTGDVTGGTVNISAIDSGANTNLAINAKGTGTIAIGNVSTGGVTVTPLLTASNGIAIGVSFSAPGLVNLTALAVQASNSVVLNATSGSASPTAQVVSSCSTAASALIWTTNTGFGCNTSITANAVPAANLTGTTLASSVVTSSLTTVGTIGTGTWHGTIVGITYGGTGTALVASNGGIVYSDASQLQILAGTSTAGLCLLSASNTAPTWGSCSGAAAVSSVTAGDTTLTISPTTGSVVAQLNLARANTWTGNLTVSTASLIESGAISAAAWGGSGIRLKVGTGTLTDTSSSGTVTNTYSNYFAGDTLASSNVTTFTNYYEVYIGAPSGSGNATITNAWALGTDNARFGTSNPVQVSSAGLLTVPGTANFTGTFQISGNAMTFPGAAATIPQTIASGATALGTGAISSGACATVVTATATGTATTDAISAAFSADPSATTGYVPSTSGMLTILIYPTSGNVNFKVCNNTAASITPGAVTLNWRVVR